MAFCGTYVTFYPVPGICFKVVFNLLVLSVSTNILPTGVSASISIRRVCLYWQYIRVVRQYPDLPLPGTRDLVVCKRTSTLVQYYTYKVPLRVVVDFESPACRRFERGNAGVPMLMGLCEARWCCTAAAAGCTAAVVLRECFRKSEGVRGWDRPARCVQDDTPAYAHTRMNTEEPFVAVTKKKVRSTGSAVLPWLPRPEKNAV